MAQDNSQAAWKQMGLVIMPVFNTLYQPLRTLKLTQNGLTKRPEVKVWNDRPLSALKPSPQLEMGMPEAKTIRPLQRLSNKAESHLNVSSEVKVALEAVFGLSASSNCNYELEFYSSGVTLGDLSRCIMASERADDWMQLTKDSRRMVLLDSPVCGIVTEVWYAKGYKVSGGAINQGIGCGRV